MREDQNELVEVDATVKRETVASWVVDPGFVDLQGEPTGKVIFIPKSRSRCEGPGRTLHVELWLAEKENLI